MKKMVISLLYIGFSLGFILGVILTSVIVTLYCSDGSLHLYAPGFSKVIRNPLAAFLILSLTCGILGMVMVGSMAFYEIEEWDLLKATLIHFLLSVAGFYLTAFFLRWFSPANTSAVCTSLLMFITVYTGIWFSQYLSYRTQIKEINQKLYLKKAGQKNIRT